MKTADDDDEIFDSSKEVEMSVSDPEEYLITRSDEEDSIYSLQGIKTSITLNSQAQNTLIQRDEEDEDEYTIKINMEFSECTERGLFCGTFSQDHPVHYHCPCCFKHSETAIPAIEAHYKSCVNKMVDHSTHASSACKHDQYITFRECKSSSSDCLASDLKLPNHYHCPCCLIYTQQNLNQVVRHQLFCCKTLNDLRNTSRDTCKASTSSSASHENKCHDNHNDLEDDLGAKYDICTHSSDVIKYKICFKDDTNFSESEERNRKKLHFHCLCCNQYTDSKLRSLRKHQKSCCGYAGLACKVIFILEISQALEQYNALQTARKRSAPAGGDPMALLATKSKAPCRRNIELSCIDDSLFPKCQRISGVCRITESHRFTHYHCPVCDVFTTRRLQRAKVHYTKCLGLNKKAKAKSSTPELQCVRVDVVNNVFLVRSSTSGPGMPIHVVYKGGQHKNILYCEDGCRLDRKTRTRCKHLLAVEQYLSQNRNSSDAITDVPIFSDMAEFYHFNEDQKSDICILFRQCSILGTPVICPYYPNIASNRPVFTFYSVSTCTTPKYFSRAARVLVTYNERTQTFKCKCSGSGGCECVHINIAHLYHAHFSRGFCSNSVSTEIGGNRVTVAGGGDSVTTHTVHHDMTRDLSPRSCDLHHPHSSPSSLHATSEIDASTDDLSDGSPYYMKLLIK